MSTRPILSRLLRTFVLVGSISTALFAAPAKNPLLDRWALNLPNGAAGWLEIKQEKGWLDGSILWGGGSVLPLASVTLEGDTAVITRVREIERKDADGKVTRKQVLTETLTAKAEGDMLRLSRVAPRPDGSGFDRAEVTGKRIPPLPARPDLSKVKFGAPITLLQANALTGWRLIEPAAENGWSLANGVLSNRPIEAAPGQPKRRFGNLRTDQEFEDFSLALEVNVPKGSNSGVYLRGIYEVQVFDSAGKPLDPHNMGAVYSRITPTVSAEKPAGEWQSLLMTLVDRHVTVVLNGKTIIDNQPVDGCTGGALWSDQFRPGPIYLQGDHGPVSYRNMVLRPVVK
ncbi:MAG: DUF1080 domain-containing protein [Opitutaceae bacterium]|nr:DUF1080 domain-containing protein [Opitutaceae bacterium]